MRPAFQSACLVAAASTRSASAGLTSYAPPPTTTLTGCCELCLAELDARERASPVIGVARAHGGHGRSGQASEHHNGDEPGTSHDLQSSRSHSTTLAFREIAGSPSVDELVRGTSDPLAVAVAREVLERAREEIRAGSEPGDLLARLEEALGAARRPVLRRVLNATGVLVHTNLGRAPLAQAALDRIANASGYSNLEYDLSSGSRGSRQDHLAPLLRRLTGAEAAIVVNNNAAAMLLALAALAEGREVVVSRGELIEIGDGFRIPDVLARSGARLVEVGTTNRTRAADYERAIGPETALLLRVHQSNFRVVGFTEQPRLDELAAVARRHELPLLDDLGSGALVDVEGEPTPAAALAARADLVCFSGDKLLGGPQAGIVVGRADLVEKLRRHPLQRALRSDKLTLAALGERSRSTSTGRTRSRCCGCSASPPMPSAAAPSVSPKRPAAPSRRPSRASVAGRCR